MKDPLENSQWIPAFPSSNGCFNLDALRRQFRSRSRILETVKNRFSRMMCEGAIKNLKLHKQRLI